MKKHQGKVTLGKDIQTKQEHFISSCPSPSSFHKHFPNTLTILRLLGTPLCVWFIAHNLLIVAFWIFFTISLTDWFDGYLARRWQATSKFGQILDPIADKFLIMSVYLALGWWAFIPLWLTVLVLSRDLLILLSSSGIMFMRQVKMNLTPTLLGKISTTAQMLFAGFMLARDVFASFIPTSSVENILMVSFLYSVTFLTILSGVTYGRMAVSAFRNL
jgi:cardiolipin synthase